MVGAVIYVRVSTKEQTENLSLPTQLKACEEYCQLQGFNVLARFREEGESAKTTDRSQLQSLLKYCRLNKGRVHFVVVFNLTRFARDKYDHFALRSLLQSLGISLRSATEPIDDTSTGKLMEGVLAAFAQFDNDCRSDRTRAGMKAALELGRWVFLAPIGYLNAPRAMGKSLMPDPERAPLVRQAFRDFATGRFNKEDVRRNVSALGLKTRRGQAVPSQTFNSMLRNRVYIGLIDVPDYGVSTRGDFDPLITERVFPARKRLPQVSLGERDTGSGFQIPLESDRPPLVGEFHDDHDLPGLGCRGVNATTGVVRGQTRIDIGRETRVVSRRVGPAADHVNEVLGAHRRTGWATRAPAKTLRKYGVRRAAAVNTTLKLQRCQRLAWHRSSIGC